MTPCGWDCELALSEQSQTSASPPYQSLTGIGPSLIRVFNGARRDLTRGRQAVAGIGLSLIRVATEVNLAALTRVKPIVAGIGT